MHGHPAAKTPAATAPRVTANREKALIAFDTESLTRVPPALDPHRAASVYGYARAPRPPFAQAVDRRIETAIECAVKRIPYRFRADRLFARGILDHRRQQMRRIDQRLLHRFQIAGSRLGEASIDQIIKTAADNQQVYQKNARPDRHAARTE